MFPDSRLFSDLFNVMMSVKIPQIIRYFNSENCKCQTNLLNMYVP